MLYMVIVKYQGKVIGEHRVEALTSLAAINKIERRYGEPVKIEYVTVELEDGKKRQVMLIHNWHGYSFHARRLTTAP